jgi:Fe-S-cluster containining protein
MTDTHRGQLARIYARFETDTQSFTTAAACSRGCAYCCKAAGSIDATTQEGLVIKDYLRQLSKPQRKQVEKALLKEIRQREQGRVVACPFLQRNDACIIYAVRPFSCRRIYSLHVCTPEAPPQVHRQVMAKAAAVIATLRRNDPNGYSGHLSFILHMLAQERFLSTYLAGHFEPETIMAFGQTHRISINRMAPAADGDPCPDVESPRPRHPER